MSCALGKHWFDIGNNCVNCGRTRADVEMESSMYHTGASYRVNDKRSVKPEGSDIEGLSAEERKQSKADMRVVHLLEKMAEAHANFLYHKERAEHYLAAGQEINQRITQLVHKLSEQFRVIPHEGNDRKTETRAPQNFEEFIHDFFSRMS